ncbi:GMC family oxidoreductase [Pseudonocardia acaciae]|uniref:GMC family oxidoreductase n=1 Tax=Pseudonocardia acaciae TaxID=551276 RepID=UPI000688B7D6|nr:GMC family oxidoreductase N-terminal domain-containing protein [Pseudonocardia acaciae]
MPDQRGTTRRAVDVIVVGAGSAGAAAAGRLVERGRRVLLLEAGGTDTNPAIHDPARSHELWFAPEDWGYHTIPQRHADGRRLHWPRGRVLGGSSALNAMVFVRGHRADYDHWAYLGNAGWSWHDVLPIFRRMEDFDAGASELHGTGGPLHVMTRYRANPVHDAIVASAQQTGIRLDADYNDGDPDGVSYIQLNIRDGQRNGTAAGYLRPILGHPNLTVLTDAHARRLLFDGDRCTGVEWVRGGRVERGFAESEVIVSAGTIESPRLLMLSGIGPADELRGLGIDVRTDLPGVGGNLHDHLLSPVIVTAQREIEPPAPGLSQAQTHLFWRSRGDLPAPDVQPIHFSVPLYEPWMDGPANGFSLMAGMIRPASRGRIRLGGTELDSPPLIDPAVLSQEADLAALAAAVELCREVGAAAALREWGAEERYPGPRVRTADELRRYVRSTAITYHHQVGTCKMGVDSEAVVDPELRVYGTEGLRVADASVMPAVTSGNTNAPSVLIGERVADFVAPVTTPAGGAMAHMSHPPREGSS